MSHDAALDQQVIDRFVGASHGDLATVRVLLAEQPALLHARARWDESPLGAAAHAGAVDVAEYLLARGAVLDICTAAMLGDVARVREFLAADPSLAHAGGAHGIPVLFHAAIHGRLDVAELLAAHGADVNAGEGGNTALHAAARFGRLEMTRWLLARGARVSARDFEGKTPLRLALDGGHGPVADLLRAQGGEQ